LVIERTIGDEESLVGEECHINSRQNLGPRHKENDINHNEYDNLILLCRVHHKIVDDQVNEYTEDNLREIKNKHELWVKDCLEKGTVKPIRLRNVEGEKLEFLYRIYSGKQLFNIIAEACGSYTDHPDPENEHEVALFSDFLQNISDWSDLSGDLQASERVRAKFDLSRALKELEEEGFWVFGNIEKKILEGGVGAPQKWNMAHIQIVRNDSPLIFQMGKNG
jgi:hypothetical protein